MLLEHPHGGGQSGVLGLQLGHQRLEGDGIIWQRCRLKRHGLCYQKWRKTARKMLRLSPINQPTRAGGAPQDGLRQSIPSHSIASCALVRRATASPLPGHGKVPFCRILYLSQKCRCVASLAAPCYRDPPLPSVFRTGRCVHCKARQPIWQALAASLCRWPNLLRSAAVDRCGNP